MDQTYFSNWSAIPLSFNILSTNQETLIGSQEDTSSSKTTNPFYFLVIFQKAVVKENSILESNQHGSVVANAETYIKP